MTEVPDYLLERSRARRAALGLGGDDPGATATATTGAASPVATPAAAPVAGTEPSIAVPAAVSSVLAPEAPVVPAPSRGPRSGVPVWMMPVLLLLPLWGIVYMGAFGEKGPAGPLPPIKAGEILFQQKAGCAGCHGSTGGGGVGPKLSGNEAELTFPTAEAQIAFVKAGSGPTKGQPYGDPARPGGQRIAKSGGMPTFGGQLTDEEIANVVLYERDGL